MKIALVASRGGHSSQIKMICTKNIIGNRKIILITESNKKDEKIEALLRFKRIFKKEKIGLVITTGAYLSIPALIAAKMIGIKTIYIETVIRVKTPTWSGKFSYAFSDIFLVQNPGMEKYYGKRAKYAVG